MTVYGTSAEAATEPPKGPPLPARLVGGTLAGAGGFTVLAGAILASLPVATAAPVGLMLAGALAVTAGISVWMGQGWGWGLAMAVVMMGFAYAAWGLARGYSSGALGLALWGALAFGLFHDETRAHCGMG